MPALSKEAIAFLQAVDKEAKEAAKTGGAKAAAAVRNKYRAMDSSNKNAGMAAEASQRQLAGPAKRPDKSSNERGMGGSPAAMRKPIPADIKATATKALVNRNTIQRGNMGITRNVKLPNLENALYKKAGISAKKRAEAAQRPYR